MVYLKCSVQTDFFRRRRDWPHAQISDVTILGYVDGNVSFAAQDQYQQDLRGKIMALVRMHHLHFCHH